jgi:hypothetical protein
MFYLPHSTYLTFSLLCIIKEGICVSRPSDGSKRSTAHKWMLLALNTLSLYPAYRYVPSHSITIFKLCRRRFQIKIAFTMTVSKVQGQMFKRDGIYEYIPRLLLPMVSSSVIFRNLFI